MRFDSLALAPSISASTTTLVARLHEGALRRQLVKGVPDRPGTVRMRRETPLGSCRDYAIYRKRPDLRSEGRARLQRAGNDSLPHIAYSLRFQGTA